MPLLFPFGRDCAIAPIWGHFTGALVLGGSGYSTPQIDWSSNPGDDISLKTTRREEEEEEDKEEEEEEDEEEEE